MALSQEAKDTFLFTHRATLRHFGPSVMTNLLELGPSGIIQNIIDAGLDPGHRDYKPGREKAAKHILANRQEAEQFYAGLLGLL